MPHYQNVFGQPSNLASVPPKLGGMCSILYCKWEDVATWPAMDPATGILTSTLQLKPGKNLYLLGATEKDRIFTEAEKTGAEGPYIEMHVTGKIAGYNAATLQNLNLMKHHQWCIIVQERTGDQFLIGDKDTGAAFTFDKTSGDSETSRMVNISFAWQSANTAPTYKAAAFSIAIGGRPYVVSNITFVAAFVVGAVGAPMVDSQTTYTNALLANKKLLLLADGLPLPVDDGSGLINWSGSLVRHAEKTLASATTTIPGGAVQNETLEFYAYN